MVALKGILANKIRVKAEVQDEIKVEGKLAVGMHLRDNVINKATHFEFPLLGKETNVYIATEENAAYRWDAEKKLYFCVGRDYTEIELVKGGNA